MRFKFNGKYITQFLEDIYFIVSVKIEENIPKFNSVRVCDEHKKYFEEIDEQKYYDQIEHFFFDEHRVFNYIKDQISQEKRSKIKDALLDLEMEKFEREKVSAPRLKDKDF